MLLIVSAIVVQHFKAGQDDEFVWVEEAEAQHDRDPIVNRDPIEDPIP